MTFTDIFGLSEIVVFLLTLLAFFGGVVKGIVGFALPMILLSGLTLVAPAHTALGALILPTVATNLQQALSQNPRDLKYSIIRLRVFLITGAVFLILGALVTPFMPLNVFMTVLGASIVLFSLYLLIGFQVTLSPKNTAAAAGIGSLAGFLGGVSGIWGPPTVAYLTALNTPKDEQISLQGVIYGLGAALLLIGHSISGIFNTAVMPLSALLVLPAYIGIKIGARVRDHLNQMVFRYATLVILLIAGLNLLRRAIFS